MQIVRKVRCKGFHVIKRLVLACAALAIPASAQAMEVRFSYYEPLSFLAPAYWFSFNISSSPTPVAYASPFVDSNNVFNDLPGYTEISTSNWQGNVPDPGAVTFYSSIPLEDTHAFNGGFVVNTPLSPIYGTEIQLYTGPESAPMFAYSDGPVPSLADLIAISQAGGNMFFFDGAGMIEEGAAVEITAVPEPATWISMITGLGIAGMALRRRSRNCGNAYAHARRHVCLLGARVSVQAT
jgi:hypothetical protein